MTSYIVKTPGNHRQLLEVENSAETIERLEDLAETVSERSGVTDIQLWRDYVVWTPGNQRQIIRVPYFEQLEELIAEWFTPVDLDPIEYRTYLVETPSHRRQVVQVPSDIEERLEGGEAATAVTKTRYYLRNVDYEQTGVEIAPNSTKSSWTDDPDGIAAQSGPAGPQLSLLPDKGNSQTTSRGFATTGHGGHGLACTFFSPPLAAQMINGGSIKVSLAYQPSAQKPAQALRVGWHIYIYRPSTGEAFRAGGAPVMGNWVGPPVPPNGSSYAHVFEDNVSMGGSPASCLDGDVIVAEMWQESLTGDSVNSVFFDGADDYTPGNYFSEISPASYIEIG